MTENSSMKVESCNECGKRNTFSDDKDGILCQVCFAESKPIKQE